MSASIYQSQKELGRAIHPIPDPVLPLNLYLADRHLQTVLARYLQSDPTTKAWATEWLTEWGAICSQEIEPLVATADQNPPQLRQFDRRGERGDELIFHPAYHEIGRRAYGGGLAAMSNRSGFRGFDGPVPQLLKTACFYIYSQVEGSISCPLSMTDTLARVLNMYGSPDLIERYGPRLTSLDYDQLYTGAMFMTEKVGGSDVGATTTIARREADGTWRLSGDKWFCSNVGADLILTLAHPMDAQAGTRGLGLFLVPRVLENGKRNSYQINRLKDKLGTRAMASGEVTLNDATAYLIEPLERGFAMMMEMVNGTRLASGMGGTGTLRRAVIEAVQHAQARQTFGQTLARQPLMAETLADLVADSRATLSLLLATAHRLDLADRGGSSDQKLLARLLISLTKRYGTSHGVKGAQTAMEVRGGNGYIEDWPNARLLRDAYVQIIWEGGVNMVSFDVLRVISQKDGWLVYAQSIEEELATLRESELGSLSTYLRQQLTLLGGIVEQVLKSDRATQEIVALQLAETMAAFYAAVMLAAETAFEIQTTGQTDTTPALQRYIQRFVNPAIETLMNELAEVDREPGEADNLIEGAIFTV